MFNDIEIEKIKEMVGKFLQTMTVVDFKTLVAVSLDTNKITDIVEVDIELSEPQFLIGQNGETLSDLGRILSIIITKNLKKPFYLKLDINNYKKKKVEYLKNLAKELADEVALTKEEKVLQPMSAYERMVIHSELAQRKDVITESQGEGSERCVVIKPVF